MSKKLNEFEILLVEDYTPEWCQRIITAREEGQSIAEAAKMLFTSVNVLKRTAEKHPEFAAAMEMAETLAAAWWDSKAREHIVQSPNGPKLDTPLLKHIYERSLAGSGERQAKGQVTVVVKTFEDDD